uniref:Uncharacterized protein n=1 Tax=Arundo donax TaxID=35708 RepID=A0A0A8YEM6_ARUDO
MATARRRTAQGDDGQASLQGDAT